MLKERAAEAAFPGLVTSATVSLHRLLKIERYGSGQSSRVGRFLLGVFNGTRHPFDFADLRFVDREIFDDCIEILRFDNYSRARIEDLIPFGDAVLTALSRAYGSNE